MIPQERRSEFSHCSCAESHIARGFQESRFVEIVTGKMFIQGTENSVVFQKRRDVAGCGGDGKGDVDRVAKNTCIAEIMAGCQDKSIRHGESGHHGMTVREAE